VETRVFTESGKPTDTRRISPADWSNHYKAEKKEDYIDPGGSLPEINFRSPGMLRQLIIFIKRDLLSKLSDVQYLLITLLEAPILAAALSFLIRYFDESVSAPRYTLYENSNLPVYIFMSVIIAIFMGLTVSAEEIIKDRKILKREAFLNLSWNSYLVSKVFVQLGISAIQAFTFVLIGNTIIGIKGMFFQYWLVLFSCWAGANLMGLVISDSFRAVVTIYILIPFLVIPQIILSGIMVKFEKLNPNLSSPVSIPVYGEFLSARWGYEALSVKQFKDNRYERQFYVYDKAMSLAKYKKDYWYIEVKGNLEEIQTDLGNNSRSKDFANKLRVVYNEFRKDADDYPSLKFDKYELLTPEKVTPEIITEALARLEIVRKYFVAYSNNAKDKKDALLTKLQEADNKAFLKLRDDYANESLEEFVTNKNETEKIIEFNGELVQKLDPIYMDPKYPFIKAHFYSPVKWLFGRQMDTYVVNIIVLWFMSLMFYFILYFRLLKKVLDSGEATFGKKSKITE
jgi:hypothetical protein